MPRFRGLLITIPVGAFLFTLGAHAQEEPSLGDVARQSRLQKQQKNTDATKDILPNAPAKDGQGKTTSAKDLPNQTSSKPGDAPKAKKLITNDEIPEHVGPTRTLPSKQTNAGYTPPQNYEENVPAEYWKSQIQTQKNYLVSLQDQISELANSIQFAGGRCVSNCVQWNEQQLRKQEQLESMKAQLEQRQKALEEFQDTARKQGFGSAVYDP